MSERSVLILEPKYATWSKVRIYKVPLFYV